ncbi:MAG: twin-arginine translocase TatA/TatE family subunit [Eubacteriales bacterium]|nr:twin-arginine translocase TatA/TatE family subunit [Eubacteriales bacterium]
MGLGPGEMILILVIAYVVVGPDDMAKLARTLAKTLREFRKMGTDLRAEVNDSISVPVDDLQKKMQGSDLDSVLKEIRKAEEQIGKS